MSAAGIIEERVPYPLFERVEVVLGQRIRLRNHGNKVYACPETLHDFYVQRLEPRGGRI